jgi:glycosyltransferase involved in cell wall biosynthesis
VRIAYDHQVFAQQRFGGISRYFVELAANLLAEGEHDVRVIAPFYQNDYLADPRIAHCVTGMHLRRTRLISMRRALRWGNRLALPWAWRGVHPDIIHETYFAHSVYGRARVRVLTVYDMIHELYPQALAQVAALTAAKRAAVARADHVICISECTRRDLVRLFGVPEERTSVVHLGHSLTVEASPGANAARAGRAGTLADGTPFALYVGDREAYKNFAGFLQAWARVPRLRSQLRIVAFGGRPLTASEQRLIADLGLGQHVTQVSGDDELLAAHYRSARLFVCPSRYEGFGLPPLEAMAFGCPVACSRGGSIPEVVGDAGEYFDADDTDAMSAALDRVAHDDSRRAELIALGRTQAARFTWARCAAQTAEVYRRLV